MNIREITIIGTGRFGRVLQEILPGMFPESTISMVSRNTSYDPIKIADLVIPAVPISAFESVINDIVPFLKKGSILMDVCSVKVHPKQVMRRYVPADISIIATHPMFGPGTLQKTKNVLTGLSIAVEPVQIEQHTYEMLCDIFRSAGLSVVEITAEEHDENAAKFHFTAQFLAAILKKLELQKTPIDTKSVSLLHEFAEIVQSDSIQLLQDMYRFNPYCKKQHEVIMKNINDINTSLQL